MAAVQRLHLGTTTPPSPRNWTSDLSCGGHRLFPASPRRLSCPAAPQRTQGFATATLRILNQPNPLPRPNSPARNILGSSKTRSGGAPAASERRLAQPCSRPAPPPPGSTPLPPPGNRRLWGVPRAESACLFKRPRGAPCELPMAGGGGHGRGRLAPGGPGSTTKLRPLSLRIGRALQTGGGRALSCPSLPPALPGRASGGRGVPASGPLHALSASRAPAIGKQSKGGLGRGCRGPGLAGLPACPAPLNLLWGEGPLLGPSPGWSPPLSVVRVPGVHLREPAWMARGLVALWQKGCALGERGAGVRLV